MDSSTTVYSSVVFNNDEIENVLAIWGKDFPHTEVLALVAEASIDAVPKLQATFTGKTANLIGAVFPELLIEGKFSPTGLILMRLDKPANYVIQSDITTQEDRVRETVDAIAEVCSTDKKSTLFLVIDAMVPNIASVLDSIYMRLGDSVHYMGVNCGSETFQPMLCIFDNSKFVQNAVLALSLPDNQGAILEHGYHMPDEMIAATSTSNNRIVSVNWRPAFEVYSEMLLSQYGVQATKANFYVNAVHFPFGIVRADGEVLVRIPVSLQDDGSLFCIGEVPENSVLTLLKAEKADSDMTVNNVASYFASNPPEIMLTFYCAGRKMHMADGATNEIKGLQRKLDSTKIVGALSLGEIGSSSKDGYPLFHNATLVCTAWNS